MPDNYIHIAILFLLNMNYVEADPFDIEISDLFIAILSVI